MLEHFVFVNESKCVKIPSFWVKFRIAVLMSSVWKDKSANCCTNWWLANIAESKFKNIQYFSKAAVLILTKMNEA